jgi:D-alanyl-lipoteichoic acid acyltransferase DltB (MBOAT superfamily)
MLFSSPEFLFVFLPAVVLAAVALARFAGRQAVIYWLVATSLAFYGWWHPPDLAVLLSSVAVNFALGQLLYRSPSRGLLGAGIAFNIALLGFFKYAAFAVENINALSGADWAVPSRTLPLAISFFTFQKIAYLIDVYYRRTSDRKLLHYLLFASFFPQLIAGPIVHHREIVPQLAESRFARFTRDGFLRGGAMILIGLYKKVVIADGMAPFADSVFGASTPPALFDAWGGALAYAFQIYFDFSGYTDIALGIGLIFGLRLPVNFNSPYKATSVIEFWQRWHITLSRFLRDCLYIPLGGNRRGPLRRYVNLMLTMLLGGLWHGAAWTFVIWGGLHGLFLVINHAWRTARGPRPPNVLAQWAGRVMTLLAITVAWVFFRADSFGSAVNVLSGMLGLNGVMAPAGL